MGHSREGPRLGAAGDDRFAWFAGARVRWAEAGIGCVKGKTVGSIKWRENQPFDHRDFVDLAHAVGRVPGAPRPKLVAVSRTGRTAAGLDRVYGPADLVHAWT